VTETGTDEAKQAIRERIWALLETAGADEGDPRGSIPAFVGADAAADRLAALPAWRSADVIKAVPDRAQLPVRVRALTEGKVVYMAVPNMADIRPFYLLDRSSHRSIRPGRQQRWRCHRSIDGGNRRDATCGHDRLRKRRREP
jgi:5-formyltetrahydrofolate cyclo-ligase